MSNASMKSQPGRDAGALVYVVDDEPMLLELATAILEPHGYRVESFRDPETAMQHFADAQPRPDLLITDYAMHTMNGMQLMTKCRMLEPRQKVLLVSGTVGEEIFAGSAVRPDEFLAKPYQTEQLTSLVKKLIAKQ